MQVCRYFYSNIPPWGRAWEGFIRSLDRVGGLAGSGGGL